MRILLIADLEGIIGVYSLEDYEACQNAMCDEVESIIKTISSSTNNVEIFLADCHNDGKTTLPLAIRHNEVTFFSSFCQIDFSWGYDMALLIGMHGMVKEGKLGHVFRPEFKKIMMGNKEVDETVILIQWLAEQHIPVVFVSGEDVVEKRVCQYNISFCATKKVLESDISKRGINDIRKSEMEKIKRALKKKNETNPYTKENMRVCVDSVLLKMLGDNGFKIKNAEVLFQDVGEFMNNLNQMAEVCNEYQVRCLRERYLKMIQLYKKLSFKDIKDPRAVSILNKQINEIAPYELRYLEDNYDNYVREGQ